MPTWFIYSLLSLFLLAGYEISQKISLTQKVNISAVTNNFYVWMLQGVIGLVLAIVLGQFSLNIDSATILKLGLIGLVYFAGGTLFYTSYKGNSPSISLILGTVSVVFSSAFGIIFLQDSFTVAKIVGVALIMFAILFVNFNRAERFNKYNLFALLGGVCFGVAYTIDKSIVVTLSPYMYLALMCFSVAFVSLVFGGRVIVKESKMMVARNFVPIMSAGLFCSAFNLFTFFSYRNGANVGIADAMNNSSIFIVILLEILLLKDRSNLVRKLVAACVAIAGIVVIGVVG